MDQNREWEQEEVEFQINEIVWAKITGFPWWPAKITNKAYPPQHLYRVDFFSDNTHAFLNYSKIAKYDTLRDTLDIGRQTSKTLKKAIAEADKALEQQKVKANVAEPCTVPVEVINLNQKQLLQQSSPPLQEQQEIIPSSHIQDQQRSHLEEEGVQQDDNSPQQIHQSHTITFSRQQRQRFVKTLLKKYRLISLPKCDDLPAQKTANKSAPYPLRKRHIYSRKSHQTKIKRPIKLPYPKQTLQFLLARKIHHLLKQKQGLKGLNSKEISLSLSRQLLCGGGGAQEVSRLFRWIGISSAETINSFYQNWSSIQTDKEKASNMTTQE